MDYDVMEHKAITVEEFEQLIKDIQAQRSEVEAKKALLSAENEKLEALETKALEALKATGKDSYQGAVGTVYTLHRMSVSVPKDPEKRKLFFEYLQKKGVYDSLITINSQTLNAFYKSEFEAAKEAGLGLEFQVPGIEEPKIFESVGFRKAK